MVKLISETKYTIKGRGEVYCIDIAKNNISPLRKEFNLLIGEKVEIDGTSFWGKGIEAFATGEDYEHSKIGLLVVPAFDETLL